MSRILTVACLAILAVAAAALIAPDRGEISSPDATERRAPEPAPALSAPSTPAAARPAAGDGVQPAVSAPRTRPSAGSMVLPSGERVRGLNRIDGDVELLWPRDLPYSPITGTRVDAEGIEWYLHEDGSQSTTRMVFRSDVGREVAMSMVANPQKDVLPLRTGADEAAAARRR